MHMYHLHLAYSPCSFLSRFVSLGTKGDRCYIWNVISSLMVMWPIKLGYMNNQFRNKFCEWMWKKEHQFVNVKERASVCKCERKSISLKEPQREGMLCTCKCNWNLYWKEQSRYKTSNVGYMVCTCIRFCLEKRVKWT